MDIIDKFFVPECHVEDISGDDYKRVTPVIDTFDALARMTFQSTYIIDFYRKEILHVSENPFFLCGLSPLEVKKMGVMFQIEHIPEEEHGMLTEINSAGFSLVNQTPIEHRLKLTFSCDFHIRNRDRINLVNHKLTPLALSRNGNMWLAGCAVSFSSWQNPGHFEVRVAGKADSMAYSPESRKWIPQDVKVLKDREKEILLLSAQGLTMNEMSEKMHIGTDAIKSHKQKLFQKLDVNNISEALSVATCYKMI
jgi:DNA-binding CsgD family transcriptional regulator